jgi:ABC-type transport system involved in cytochrome c biogenesis permease component
MTFLPIVTRELRVTARKRSTYWIRFAAAALALAVCGWSLLFFTRMGMGNASGKMLFGGATALAWLYAVIGGIFKTADALSEEKREGTLGLLFLTDLKGYDIVLGKIVAASVNWFFGLIAIFPILGVSLLMGGVAPGEFWREILALANLLFYSLALGMFVSSFMHNERKAAGLTIALLLLLLWLPAQLAEWHRDFTGGFQPGFWFIVPDVTRPLHYASDALSRANSDLYWSSLIGSHLVGWFYLLLASVIVPRTWQQQAGKISRLQESAEQFTYGHNRERRKRFRERALALNPFYWIAARARGQSLVLWIILTGIVVCFLISWAMDPSDYNNAWIHLWPAFILHTVVKLWIPLAACRRFIEDRRSGALELILSTPLTPGEILRGQSLALWKQFRGPVLFILVVDVLLLLLGWTRISSREWKEQLLYTSLSGAGVIAFLADLVALAWLSMWRGMKARHSYVAWLWSVVQLLVLPWVAFYVAMTAGMMLIFVPRVLNAGGPNTGASMTKWMEWLPLLLTSLWFLLSMAAAIISAWWARRCLHQHFRYQATLSYQPVKANWSPPVSSATLPPRLA